MKLLKQSILLTVLLAIPSLAQVNFGIRLESNHPNYSHWSPVGGHNNLFHHEGNFYRHESSNGNWGYRRTNDNFWLGNPPSGVLLGPTLVPTGRVERVNCNC